MELDAATVAERLALGSDYTEWLASLEELGTPSGGLPLPSGTEATELLEQLGVDEVDRRAILSAYTAVIETPELWWLVERAYHGVLSDVGQLDARRLMPSLPSSLGPTGQCFWIVVFLAAVDSIRRWHRSQGISDTVSWETLVDLGRHIRLNRLRTGSTGLATQSWISLHFKGALYALGRLQFAPYRLRSGPAGPLFWYDDEDAALLGTGFRRGDPALGLHIPESGPLTPAACTNSFRAALTFFQCHLPKYADAVVTCTSWLLDDQLLEYLAHDSNIVLFLRRFKLVAGWRESDESVFHFVHHYVSGCVPDSIDALPTRTTLERAIVRHIKQGGHWRQRTGWLKLADQATPRNLGGRVPRPICR